MLVDTIAKTREDAADALAVSTILAVERTRVAYDRTMMAWIRTAISLITLGFAIYKFFDIDQQRVGVARRGPRIFGITMVVMGLLSLLLGAVENREHLRALHDRYSTHRRSMASMLALMIAILGILALVVMLIRA